MAYLRIVVLLYFSLASRVVAAQPLSDDEALSFAARLRDKRILSEHGEQALVEAINERMLVNVFASPDQDTETLNVSSILFYCARLFDQEVLVRSGLINRSKAAGIKREVRRDLRRYQRIEAAIQGEDRPYTGWRVLPPFFPANDRKMVSFIDASRSTIGKTRVRTARDIFEVGLIDDRVSSDLTAALDNGEVLDEAGVFSFAALRSYYYEIYPAEKNKQVDFLDRLQRAGLIVESKKEEILKSYAAYELKERVALIAQCEGAMVMNTDDYSSSLKFYEAFFYSVSEIVPAFNFRDLHFLLRSSDDGGHPHKEQMISLTVGGIKYTIVNDPYYDEQLDTDPRSWTNGQAYQLVNKWLADSKSPVRLYRVHNSLLPGFDTFRELKNRKTAFIALDAIQRAMIGNQSGFSYECHDNELSNRNLLRIVERFDSVGMFTHLTSGEIKKRTMDLLETAFVSYYDILRSFNVVTGFSFDIEGEEEPYANRCRWLSAISRGNFVPSLVSDTNGQASGEGIVFRFDFMGRRYERMLTGDTTRLDLRFIEVINRALEQNSVKGKFYQCYEGESGADFVFLTSYQYSWMKQSFPGLITARDAGGN
jgi:hypothetical protein